VPISVPELYLAEAALSQAAAMFQARDLRKRTALEKYRPNHHIPAFTLNAGTAGPGAPRRF
jgi:hypothetical protein